MNVNSSNYVWQDEFIARYHSLNQDNFTLHACPGAGKTKASVRLAKELIEVGVIDFIWIVCPTRVVKKQWAIAASNLGLDIEWKWEHEDGALPSDMNGAAVTYGAVASQPAIHRYHVGRHRTLVIFDEIHHAEEEAVWGKASQEAFELAVRRLMLTGTPFRSSGTIPFVAYERDENGNEYVLADFVYGYDRAQMDFVCRSIYFPRKGGQVEWEWKEQEFSHSFDEKLPQRKASMRLRAAIFANEDEINPVAEQLLQDADAKISALRKDGYSDTGGLVIAMGKDKASGIRHASAIADHMERLFGRRPPVVVGDDPAALNRIEAFKNSTERWLVSINMVSEGVDIPRLRVLAYVTNISSELYFDQASGRIVRGTGDAFFFIPDDELLRDYAQRLADLRKAALKHMVITCGPPADDNREVSATGFKSLGGVPADAGVIYGQHRIDHDEYISARDHLHTTGWPPPVAHEVVSKYVLATRAQSQPNSNQSDDSGGMKSERKEKSRQKQNRLVRAHCFKTGAEYAMVNRSLNEEVGITKLKQATEDQLTQRLELVKELVGDEYDN